MKPHRPDRVVTWPVLQRRRRLASSAVWLAASNCRWAAASALKALDDGKSVEQVLDLGHEALVFLADLLLPPGEHAAGEHRHGDGQNAERDDNDRQHRAVPQHHADAAKEQDRVVKDSEAAFQIVCLNCAGVVGEDGQVAAGIFPGKGTDALLGQPAEGQGFVLDHGPTEEPGFDPMGAQVQRHIKEGDGHKDFDGPHQLLHAPGGGGVQQLAQQPGHRQRDGNAQQGEQGGEPEIQAVAIIKGPEIGPGGGIPFSALHCLSSSVLFHTPPRSRGFPAPPTLNR